MRRNLAGTLRVWSRVIKLNRCLPIALSAGFGFILQRPVPDAALGGVVAGVLLLACGCAGLNSVQEARMDRLYRRTCDRPVATGLVRRGHALALSVTLVALGLGILFADNPSRLPPLLGLAAVLLYNGLYTPLKQISVFALVPGGLAGGLPPLIGWTAAGGGLADLRPWLLFALFFLWQIPHYCLILLRHRDDYRAVAQPSLIRLFSESLLKNITLVWVGALAVVAMTLALDRDLLQPGSRLTLAGMAVFLVLFLGQRLLRTQADDRLPLWLFNGVFFSALLVVALVQLLAAG